MKAAIRNLLGYKVFYHLREFKYNWFPSQNQKDYVMREAEEDNKRRDFYALFVNKGDLCFDVGANVGNRIRPLLSLGARVVAIEPQETCYKYLRLKFKEKIKVVTKGLGETETVKDFHIADDATLSTFSDDWLNAVKDGRFKERSWDNVVKVEMTTLDKLFATYGVPKFIKIDVEGYELEVLKGLSQPVHMISFEYTVPEQTSKALQCIEQIYKSNPRIECNYSIGESMEFELSKWLSVDDMKEHIFTPTFTNTVFGDIYVRTKA